MRITLAVHHFPPHYRAGAEQYVYRLARSLQGRGHTIEVICVEAVDSGQAGVVCKPDVFDGLSVQRLYLDLSKAPDAFRWSFNNPEIGGWFREHLQANRPDVLHLNSPYLLSAVVPYVAHDLRLPTVLTLHDFWFVCPRITLLRADGQLCDHPVSAARCVWCLASDRRRYRLPDQLTTGRLGDLFTRLATSDARVAAWGIAPSLEAMEERRRYVREALELVDVILSPSQFLLDKLRTYGLPLSQARYLPLGLERQPAAPPVPAARRPAGLRIGYLGQLAVHKGVHVLMEAFARLDRPATLRIHGDYSAGTPYQRQLLRLRDQSAHIEMPGPYVPSALEQILSEIDVLVVPSVWYENRPAVILEAFVHGRPVIVSDLGGMAELVAHDVNGLRFPAGDSEQLARALRRLCDEPGLLERLGAGIPRVPRADEEVDELEAIYRQVLASAPGSRA